MSWQLTVLDPTFSTILTAVTEATSPPVTIESPECTVSPDGDCIEMTLRVGRPDTLAVPTRGILTYVEDGNALFAGPAITLPAPDSKGAGPADDDADALSRISVAGGRLLVEESTCGPALWIDKRIDISLIAYALCDMYAHPALTVNLSAFETTGQTLPTWYAPYRQLSDALDDLVGTLEGGGAWWVDGTLALHFKANTTP